ncbi:MAG: LCP family protein [Lachnospiraceae bacterium]
MSEDVSGNQHPENGRGPENNGGGGEQPKKGGAKKAVLIIVAVLLIILCIVLAVIYFGLRYINQRSNYVSDSSVTINPIYLNQDADSDQTGEYETIEEVSIDPEAQSEIEAQMVNVGTMASEEQEAAENIYDILLIGSDRRQDNWYGNSDAMILVTINDYTDTIYMTSFMRDLYADIPGVGVRKLNAAHAIGGGPLLVTTLETNYGVDIDNYASVNFLSMASIIDLIGGADVNITTAEAAVANKYIDEICEIAGVDSSAYHVSGRDDGVLTHLNGIQAVGYARIRYVGNADYERTERQREVLTSLVSELKQMGVTQIISLVNEILPMITHNIDSSTEMALITKIPDMLSYDIVQMRVPFDGYYTSSNEILIPDFSYTISTLRGTLYSTEEAQ